MMRKAFIALVLLAALFMDLKFMTFGQKATWPIDFQVFWLAAHAPIETIYSARAMPFAYPPTSLWLFKPLALLSFIPAYLLWLTASALLFGLAVARFVGGRAAALTFLSPAALSGILLGQSSMLLGGLSHAAFQVAPAAGGVLLGLVATVKPQLVLLAPLALLIRRDWKMLGGMVATIVATAALISIWRPTLWSAWLGALRSLNHALVATNATSVVVTPAGRAEFYGLPQIPFLLLGLAVGVVAIIFTARRLEKENLVALITSASLAASPYAHVHDAIALIPVCLLLMLRRQWWAAVPAGLIVVGQPDLVALSLLVGLAILAAANRPRDPAAAIPSHL